MSSMIVAWSLVFSLLLIGNFFSRHFFSTLPNWLRFLVTILSATVVGGWLLFLLVVAFGFEAGLSAILSLGLICAAYFASQLSPKLRHIFKQWSRSRLAWRQIKLTKTDFFGVMAAILWMIWLGWLFHTHNFLLTDEGYFSAGSAYGDLALHATQINFFAHQPELDLSSPIYALTPNTYPFMLNFVAGMMVRWGIDLTTALHLTSASLFPVLLGMIWLNLKNLGGTSRSFVFASSFLLLGGGLGGYYFFLDWFESSLPLTTFLLNQPHQYAHLAAQNIYWSNFVADTLLPQRTYVVGMTVVLLMMAVVAQIFNLIKSSSKGQLHLKKSALKSLVGASILLGFLPLFHIHSFLVGFALLFWLMMFLKFKKFLHWRELFVPLLIVVVLSAPQLWWQLSQTTTGGFVRLQLGWMAGEDSVGRFWLANLGPSSLLFFFAIFTAWKKRSHLPFLWALLLPLISLFLISNIVIFQPYDYDNIKFMIYSYLGVCLISALFLDDLFKKRAHRWLIFLIIIVINFTGLVSLIRESALKYQLSDSLEIQLAEQIIEKTDNDSIFLTADRHNHPATMLAGRKVLMGYRGWLWTHGIDYQEVERDVLAIYEGTNRSHELLDQYQVEYIFLGPTEINDFRANQNFFAKNFELVIDHPRGQVYRR